MHTHLGTCADQQGTDIERGPTLVGRNETLVEAHHLIDHLVELVSRQFGHEDAAAGTLQACGILVAAEHTHLAVRTTVCLETLESLLAVVQARGSHVHGYRFLATYLNLAPCAIAVVASHVIVGFAVAKTKVGPIQFFHDKYVFVSYSQCKVTFF